MKKDLEILNLTTINSELIIGLEKKNEMIKDLCRQNRSLKNEIERLEKQEESMKSHLAKIVEEMKHYKTVISDYSVNRTFDNSTRPAIEEVNESECESENVSPEKGKGKSQWEMMNIRKTSMKNNNNVRRNTARNFCQLDYYTKITLKRPSHTKQDFSLTNALNGHIGLFKYDTKLVNNIIYSEKFKFVENIFMSYEAFIKELESSDEIRLDDLYFLLKGIVSDYKATLTLLAKVNKLLDVQHIFCEKFFLSDVFEKICLIICQTIECDTATLYLCDNVRKELWSKSSQGPIEFFKLPFGKGLAGYVAQNQCSLVIDDAYQDSRFIHDYDLKTGYKTKSVLCVPIFDNVTREVIGVMQAINKKSKSHVFDINDEITGELLCRMISTQLKQSMEYSDYIIHEHKLKKLLDKCQEIFQCSSVVMLASRCRNLIKNIFSTDKVEIYLILKELKASEIGAWIEMKNVKDTSRLYRFIEHEKEKFEFLEIPEGQGIVGEVRANKTTKFVSVGNSNEMFNQSIDIDTSFPFITFPVFHPLEESSVIAVMQIEYNISSKPGFNDSRMTQIDKIDKSIVDLLTRIFSLSLFKFFE